MAEQPRTFGGYVLLKSLGSGGTGDVHLARPDTAGSQVPSPVVIKRLHGQLAKQQDFVRRFTHEGTIAVAVDSPHVAKVFDVGRVGETFFLAIEYVAGWTVSRLMKDLEDAGRTASIESAVDIVAGALKGLAALHDARDPTTGEALGFIHRDIAPKNIMVGEDGVTRLIDLGLGRSSIQDWKTSTGLVMGSPGYMAPEQVIAEGVTQRVDIYAMGIVLWELLTLRYFIKRAPLPLMLRAQAAPKAVPPSTHRPDLPAGLDAVVMRAIAIDPKSRFDSAEEFLAALRAVVPQRRSTGALPTLVGELLWGELNEQKTEVTQLLSRMTPTPDAAMAEVEVLATRYAPRPAQRAPPSASPFGLPLGATPTPTYASVSGDVHPGGISARAVVGLMVLTLLIGVTGTLFFTMNNAETVEATALEVTPVITTTPAVTALPNAAPSPQPKETSGAEPIEPRKRRARIGKTEPEPESPAVPAPTVKVDPKAAAKRILGEARQLLQRTKDAEVAQLVTDIARSQRSDLTATDIRRFETRLADLRNATP